MINAVFNSKLRTQHLHYEFAFTTSLASIKARGKIALRLPLPLVAGGSLRAGGSPGNGAVVVMSGWFAIKPIKPVAPGVQAYEPMGLQVFRHYRWYSYRWPDVNRVVIYHRIGRLEIGEISVLVAVGCPHRPLRRLKPAMRLIRSNTMPLIWKKEHWEDGSSSC